MTEQEQAVREIGRRMAKEEATIPGLDTAFPAGTTLCLTGRKVDPC